MELSLVVVIAYTVWISIELSNNFGDYAYLTGRRFFVFNFFETACTLCNTGVCT